MKLSLRRGAKSKGDSLFLAKKRLSPLLRCSLVMTGKGIASLVTLIAFVLNILGAEVISIKAYAAISPEIASTNPAEYNFLNVDSFTLPKYLGTIKDLWKSASGRDTVIHIQDAHCNYAAQDTIAKMIERIDSEYDIDVINLEGGAEDYDLSLFTDIEDKGVRQKVVDYFMKLGMVSGAESFVLNNQDKAKLWGVEDVDLYFDNLSAYRNSLEYKEEVDGYLKMLSRLLNELKINVYSNELLEFDLKYSAYKAGNLAFRDYVIYIRDKAAKCAIDMEEFENIALLSESLELEGKIDFKKANRERDMLIEELRRMVSKNELENLVLKTLQFKKKIISRKDYYTYLFEKARLVNIGLDGFGELRKYTDYISKYQTVDRSKILEEMSIIEDAIKDVLCVKDKDRTLVRLSKNFALLKNIFNVSLTKDDYVYYKTNEPAFAVKNYISFIKANDSSLRGAVPFSPLRGADLSSVIASPPKAGEAISENIYNLDRHREQISRFYEDGIKRDDAFLRNLRFQRKQGVGSREQGVVGEASSREQKTTILVTGGFHTKNLCELFKEKGISYVSIMPNFRNENGYESPYFNLLAGKKNDVAAALTSDISSLALYSDLLQNGLNNGDFTSNVKAVRRLWVSLVAAQIRKNGRNVIFGDINGRYRRYSFNSEDGDPVAGLTINGKQVYARNFGGERSLQAEAKALYEEISRDIVSFAAEREEIKSAVVRLREIFSTFPDVVISEVRNFWENEKESTGNVFRAVEFFDLMPEIMLNAKVERLKEAALSFVDRQLEHIFDRENAVAIYNEIISTDEGIPQDLLKYALYYRNLKEGKTLTDEQLALHGLSSKEDFPYSLEVDRVLKHKDDSNPKKLLLIYNAEHTSMVGMGDQISNVVPLVQALKDKYPKLDITIYTDKPFVYEAHDNVRVFSMSSPGINAEEVFDMAIDYSDSKSREEYPDKYLVQEAQISIVGDFNNLTVKAKGLPPLGIKVRNRSNAYSLSLRLCAELRLPVRIGTEQPQTSSIVLGPGSEEADMWWEENVVLKNTEKRKVVFLNPYGGEWKEKGYIYNDRLVKDIEALLEDGNYIVISPNDTRWGTREKIEEMLKLLDAAKQKYITISKGPSEAGNLIKHWLYRADHIVTVEGGTAHLAYNLGKTFTLVWKRGAGLLHDIPPMCDLGQELIPIGGKPQDIVDAVKRAFESDDEGSKVTSIGTGILRKTKTVLSGLLVFLAGSSALQILLAGDLFAATPDAIMQATATPWGWIAVVVVAGFIVYRYFAMSAERMGTKVIPLGIAGLIFMGVQCSYAAALSPREGKTKILVSSAEFQEKQQQIREMIKGLADSEEHLSGKERELLEGILSLIEDGDIKIKYDPERNYAYADKENKEVGLPESSFMDRYRLASAIIHELLHQLCAKRNIDFSDKIKTSGFNDSNDYWQWLDPGEEGWVLRNTMMIMNQIPMEALGLKLLLAEVPNQESFNTQILTYDNEPITNVDRIIELAKDPEMVMEKRRFLVKLLPLISLNIAEKVGNTGIIRPVDAETSKEAEEALLALKKYYESEQNILATKHKILKNNKKRPKLVNGAVRLSWKDPSKLTSEDKDLVEWWSNVKLLETIELSRRMLNESKVSVDKKLDEFTVLIVDGIKREMKVSDLRIGMARMLYGSEEKLVKDVLRELKPWEIDLIVYYQKEIRIKLKQTISYYEGREFEFNKNNLTGAISTIMMSLLRDVSKTEYNSIYDHNNRGLKWDDPGRWHGLTFDDRWYEIGNLNGLSYNYYNEHRKNETEEEKYKADNPNRPKNFVNNNATKGFRVDMRETYLFMRFYPEELAKIVKKDRGVAAKVELLEEYMGKLKRNVNKTAKWRGDRQKKKESEKTSDGINTLKGIMAFAIALPLVQMLLAGDLFAATPGVLVPSIFNSFNVIGFLLTVVCLGLAGLILYYDTNDADEWDDIPESESIRAWQVLLGGREWEKMGKEFTDRLAILTPQESENRTLLFEFLERFGRKDLLAHIKRKPDEFLPVLEHLRGSEFISGYFGELLYRVDRSGEKEQELLDLDLKTEPLKVWELIDILIEVDSFQQDLYEFLTKDTAYSAIPGQQYLPLNVNVVNVVGQMVEETRSANRVNIRGNLIAISGQFPGYYAAICDSILRNPARILEFDIAPEVVERNLKFLQPENSKDHITSFEGFVAFLKRESKVTDNMGKSPIGKGVLDISKRVFKFFGKEITPVVENTWIPVFEELVMFLVLAGGYLGGLFVLSALPYILTRIIFTAWHLKNESGTWLQKMLVPGIASVFALIPVMAVLVLPAVSAELMLAAALALGTGTHVLGNRRVHKKRMDAFKRIFEEKKETLVKQVSDEELLDEFIGYLDVNVKELFGIGLLLEIREFSKSIPLSRDEQTRRGRQRAILLMAGLNVSETELYKENQRKIEEERVIAEDLNGMENIHDLIEGKFVTVKQLKRAIELSAGNITSALETLNKLKDVIKKHGIDELFELADLERVSNNVPWNCFEWVDYDSARDLLDQYGIKPFLKMRRLGVGEYSYRSIDSYSLTLRGIFNLVRDMRDGDISERYGISVTGSNVEKITINIIKEKISLKGPSSLPVNMFPEDEIEFLEKSHEDTYRRESEKNMDRYLNREKHKKAILSYMLLCERYGPDNIRRLVRDNVLEKWSEKVESIKDQLRDLKSVIDLPSVGIEPFVEFSGGNEDGLWPLTFIEKEKWAQFLTSILIQRGDVTAKNKRLSDLYINNMLASVGNNIVPNVSMINVIAELLTHNAQSGVHPVESFLLSALGEAGLNKGSIEKILEYLAKNKKSEIKRSQIIRALAGIYWGFKYERFSAGTIDTRMINAIIETEDTRRLSAALNFIPALIDLLESGILAKEEIETGTRSGNIVDKIGGLLKSKIEETFSIKISDTDLEVQAALSDTYFLADLFSFRRKYKEEDENAYKIFLGLVKAYFENGSKGVREYKNSNELVNVQIPERIKEKGFEQLSRLRTFARSGEGEEMSVFDRLFKTTLRNYDEHSKEMKFDPGSISAASTEEISNFEKSIEEFRGGISNIELKKAVEHAIASGDTNTLKKLENLSRPDKKSRGYAIGSIEKLYAMRQEGSVVEAAMIIKSLRGIKDISVGEQEKELRTLYSSSKEKIEELIPTLRYIRGKMQAKNKPVAIIIGGMIGLLTGLEKFSTGKSDILSEKKITAEISFDLKEILKIGRYGASGEGNCQHSNSPGESNHSLMSFIGDAHELIILFRDDDGIVVGQALMHGVYLETGDFVYMKEDVYTNDNSLKALMETAARRMGKAIANFYGIKVLDPGAVENKKIFNNIKIPPSKVFRYLDSLGGEVYTFMESMPLEKPLLAGVVEPIHIRGGRESSYRLSPIGGMLSADQLIARAQDPKISAAELVGNLKLTGLDQAHVVQEALADPEYADKLKEFNRLLARALGGTELVEKAKREEREEAIEDRQAVTVEVFGEVNRKTDTVRAVIGVPKGMPQKVLQKMLREVNRGLAKNGFGERNDTHQVIVFEMDADNKDLTESNQAAAVEKARKDLSKKGMIVLFSPETDKLPLAELTVEKYKDQENITIIRDAYSDSKPQEKQFLDVDVRAALARHIAFYYNGSDQASAISAINALMRQISDEHKDISDINELLAMVVRIRPIDYGEITQWAEAQIATATSL